MLKTYYETTYVYCNDSSVYRWGRVIICDELEAVDTETTYSGYDEIQTNIEKIPCSILQVSNRKPEKEYLELWIQGTCKVYRIDKTSDATVKVVVAYRENKPRLKDLMDLEADLVFRYMAQFIIQNNSTETGQPDRRGYIDT